MAKKLTQKQVDEKVKDGFIRATMILELAGMPKAFVDKTLKEAAIKISNERIEVISEKINKAEKVGEKMFSGFIELDFLSARLDTIIGLIADYLPSSIEITEPEENIISSSQSITELLNDIIAKLHNYDRAFKLVHSENLILKKRLAQYEAGQTKK